MHVVTPILPTYGVAVDSVDARPADIFPSPVGAVVLAEGVRLSSSGYPSPSNPNDITQRPGYSLDMRGLPSGGMWVIVVPASSEIYGAGGWGATSAYIGNGPGGGGAGDPGGIGGQITDLDGNIEIGTEADWGTDGTDIDPGGGGVCARWRDTPPLPGNIIIHPGRQGGIAIITDIDLLIVNLGNIWAGGGGGDASSATGPADPPTHTGGDFGLDGEIVPDIGTGPVDVWGVAGYAVELTDPGITVDFNPGSGGTLPKLKGEVGVNPYDPIGPYA